MLRSLYSGISGLRSHQAMLDVTGNNIANANTVGFKASTTVFQDTLSQMLSGATGEGAMRGGIFSAGVKATKDGCYRVKFGGTRSVAPVASKGECIDVR